MPKPHKLTPKQVSYIRGRLKAPKRRASMAERYAKQQADEERRYQAKLAKEISKLF